MHRSLFLIFLLLIAACMPEGGPGPNAVLVIRADAYPIADVLEALDALVPGLDRRVDKQPQPLYSSAYWYPHQGSEIYGVSFVEWKQDLKGNGIEDMKNRYFIEVYANNKACSLCTSVKASLAKHKIEFFSACDHPRASTAYEHIRCGT